MARKRSDKKLKTSARSTPIEKQSKKAKQNAKRMVDEIETSGTPGNNNSFGCKRQVIPDDEMHSKDQNLKISASTTPIEKKSLCATEQVVDEIEMSGTLSNDNSFACFKEKSEKVDYLPNSPDQIEAALKALVVQWESNKDLELSNSFTQHMLSKYISSYTCMEKVAKQTRVTEEGRLEKEKDNKTASIEETKVVIDTAPLQSPSEDDLQASKCHSSSESVKAPAKLSPRASRKLCFSAQENLEAALDTLQKLKVLYPAVREGKRISPAVRQAMRINNLIMAVKFTMSGTEMVLKLMGGPQKACMEKQTSVESDRILEKEESEKTASIEKTKEAVIDTAPLQSPSDDFQASKDQLCLMHLSQKLYYSAEGNLEAAMEQLEHVKEYCPSNKPIDQGLKRIEKYMILVEITVSPRRSTQLVKLIVMQKYECELCNTLMRSRELKKHRIVRDLIKKEKRSIKKLRSSQVNRKSKKQNNIKRLKGGGEIDATKDVWRCELCNITIPANNLQSHLNGKRHKKKEEKSKMKPGSSQVNQKNDIDNNIDANQAATESAQSPKKGGRKVEDEEDEDSEEDLDLNLGDLEGIEDDDDDGLDEDVDEKENDKGKQDSQKRGKLQKNINGSGNTCVNNEKKKQAEKRPLKNMKKQTWENAPPTKKAKKINK